MSEEQVQDLKQSLSGIITGVESPVPQTSSESGSNGTSSVSAIDDDITPFPSPMLSATSLAGLSLKSDGELELEVNLDREVSEDEVKQAAEVKAKANKAFAGQSFAVVGVTFDYTTFLPGAGSPDGLRC